jgi:glutamine synthetase
MSEAPPAIMSVYLGADILGLVDWIRTLDPTVNGVSTAEEFKDRELLLHLGKSAIAPFRRDRTDRNRTSPFAFTGNKFEFRAVGSSQNVGHTVTVLNTIVADSIRNFCDTLEKTISASPSLESAIIKVNQQFIKTHERIIFEGDGYSEDWVKEAAKRGLPNLTETVVALEGFASKKNIDLFQHHGVLNPGETMARYNIYMEHYVNTINVEANVLTSVVNSNIIPAVLKHSERIARSIAAVEQILGVDESSPQRVLLKKIQGLLNNLMIANQQLTTTLETKPNYPHHKPEAEWMRDQIKPKMDAIRVLVDNLEPLIEDELWTLPKYSELLFIK